MFITKQKRQKTSHNLFDSKKSLSLLQYYLYYFTSHSEPNTTNHLGAGCGTSKCSFDSADKGTAHAVDTQIKLNKVLHVIVNSICESAKGQIVSIAKINKITKRRKFFTDYFVNSVCWQKHWLMKTGEKCLLKTLFPPFLRIVSMLHVQTQQTHYIFVVAVFLSRQPSRATQDAASVSRARRRAAAPSCSQTSPCQATRCRLPRLPVPRRAADRYSPPP